MSKLVSRNPASGEILGEFDSTPIEKLDEVFSQARLAQKYWGSLPLRKRSHFLLQLRETLINHTDDLVDLISKENGKPRYEALTSEIIPSVDMLRYFAKKSTKILSPRNIPMTLMKHRKSYLQYWPVGVVVVISPWNYPFLLPFAEILMALVAGNAVVFKPSEITPAIGMQIQDLCNEAGLPPHVLQTVLGDGQLGAALIQKKPGKIFFTGSVATGKKVMAAAAEHLIPVNLELGGKDAMIILPDANLDYATSAALWGSFTNSGQVCASTERILVHERIAAPFLQLLKEKIDLLRIGPSTALNNDLGPITFEKQKSIYSLQMDEAKKKNARFISGGEFSEDHRFLKPTVITGGNSPTDAENFLVYQDETFGPIVAVSTFKSIAEAVSKTNHSRYGLLASVITQNLALGEEVARQLEVGTVTINEVLYTAGLGETPWGGVKESGFGRTHSEIGLYEFVNIRHIHKPRSRLFVFKSLWWFPYTPFQYATFRLFIELYRKHWLDRLRALPHFMWNFVKFIKEEKRL